MRRNTQTVADVGWAFLATVRTENTHRVYRSNMLALLDQLGSRAVSSITPADLAMYCDAGPTEATRAMRRRIANHTMRHAYRVGAIRYVVLCPKPSYNAKRVRGRQWTRYSANQLRMLIEAAPCERSRIAIALGAYTAMRIEDIRLLRAPAPDLTEGWLAAFIHKTGVYDFKVISHGLEDEMRSYLRWLYAQGPVRPDDFLIPGYPPSDRSAPGGLDPSRAISKHALYMRLTEARERAGLPYQKQEKWHTLRRSSARLFFELASERGYDAALRMTQAFLNHASVTTTERYIGLDSAYAMRDEFLRNNDLLGAATSSVRSIGAAR